MVLRQLSAQLQNVARRLHHLGQVQRCLHQPDLAGHHTARVQQVAHHVRQLLRLAHHDGQGALRACLAPGAALHHLQRCRDGAQGVAQFVAEHGQELVLGAVGCLGLVARRLLLLGLALTAQLRFFLLGGVHHRAGHLLGPAIAVVVHQHPAGQPAHRRTGVCAHPAVQLDALVTAHHGQRQALAHLQLVARLQQRQQMLQALQVRWRFAVGHAQQQPQPGRADQRIGAVAVVKKSHVPGFLCQVHEALAGLLACVRRQPQCHHLAYFRDVHGGAEGAARAPVVVWQWHCAGHHKRGCTPGHAHFHFHALHGFGPAAGTHQRALCCLQDAAPVNQLHPAALARGVFAHQLAHGGVVQHAGAGAVFGKGQPDGTVVEQRFELHGLALQQVAGRLVTLLRLQERLAQLGNFQHRQRLRRRQRAAGGQAAQGLGQAPAQQQGNRHAQQQARAHAGQRRKHDGMFARLDGRQGHADAGFPAGAVHLAPGSQQGHGLQQPPGLLCGGAALLQLRCHQPGQLHAGGRVRRSARSIGLLLERQHTLLAVKQCNEALARRLQGVEQAQPGGSGHARAQHVLHHPVLVHRHAHHHHLGALHAQPRHAGHGRAPARQHLEHQRAGFLLARQRRLVGRRCVQQHAPHAIGQEDAAPLRAAQRRLAQVLSEGRQIALLQRLHQAERGQRVHRRLQVLLCRLRHAGSRLLQQRHGALAATARLHRHLPGQQQGNGHRGQQDHGHQVGLQGCGRQPPVQPLRHGMPAALQLKPHLPVFSFQTGLQCVLPQHKRSRQALHLPMARV